MRYETRLAIGCFKNRTIRKTDVREDDLSRVSVRSTGGHSKRRSGFNQIEVISNQQKCPLARKELTAQYNLCKTATLKKAQNCFSRPIIAKCRSNVLHNAPRGALSTFIKLPVAIKTFVVVVFLFLSGHFTQVLLYIK